MSESLVERPRVRTFDVFDTLIARRCIGPLRVFDIVEQRSGVAGFATARREVERRIWESRSYDFDDIYAALPEALDVTPEQLARLQELEVEVELEQVIPIAENLAAVQHGDILLSDMYLPAEVIRRLVTKAGLDKEVGIVVSSHGKHHGTVWEQLSPAVTVVEHLGDSLRGDVEIPRSLGIAARHTTTHAPNVVEQTLLEAGLPRLAQLIREIRLATWSPDARIRGVQVVQASINFPLLLAASVTLGRLVKELGRTSVAMSSRDCNLWLPLFREVARQTGLDCEAHYFYTGRLPRTRPSADYLRYARSLLDETSVVVDTCGSGWSLAVLAEHLGLTDLPVFLIHRSQALDAHERFRSTPDTVRFFSIFDADAPGLDRAQLEQANMADYGTALDVRYVAGKPVPVLGEDHRSDYVVEAIRAQQAAFLTGVELMADYDLSELYRLGQDDLDTLVGSLYGLLSTQRDTRVVFADEFHAEEADTLVQMGVPAEELPAHLRQAQLNQRATA